MHQDVLASFDMNSTASVGPMPLRSNVRVPEGKA